MDDEPEEAVVDNEPVLGIDFQRYLDALRKYVWAVIAIMALAITGAVIYTNRQPKIYEAQASVQIEPRIPDLLGQGQEILSGVATAGTVDYYKQQRQVLSSYRLVQQTVQSHHLQDVVLSDLERKDVKIEDQIAMATGRVRGMLSIRYPDQDRIMYVVVRNGSPPLAAQIANAHIATYVDYARGLLSTDTKQASNALSTEFDVVEGKLREAESALYTFQKDNDLLAVTLEERQSMVSSGITTYTNKLNETRARRIELAARLDRMRKAAKEEVLTSPILMIGDSKENNSFDSLRAQYYSERNKFIELEKEVGPKNPQYVMQKAKMDDIYSALETEAKRMLGGLEEQVQAVLATESALKNEVEKATKEALALGPKVVAYNELLRRKKSTEDRYNILRSRLSTSELTDRMNRNIDSTNVRPLDEARVPIAPVYPILRRNIVIGGALSLLLGLGLVFLIVLFDRSIKSTADAQQATGAPVLGIIPAFDQAEIAPADDRARDLYVHKHPTSRIAECCRSLRTNILFSGADRKIKTIVVSSANPREGKTMTAIYLGTTMAQSGQKVLLIDTDMRRPRLHVSTGVSRQVGISNLIVGDAEYDTVIKSTEIPNLYVLPCGPLPPNPAELLMSQRFGAVLAELTKRFDRVILDSPPLQVVTDAVVLAKQVDGVILVARAEKTLREDIRRSAKQVRAVGATIFGVIVNGIEPNNRSGYYSYYGYTEKEQNSPAST
ncbi:MAG: polysaccharide biosynthesis tyrosine autokinase [Deltaproteobacteria bacterium]|nr:polysaccharide biosynthesis tyrosine autokinase [Deltaproteobacteria bacterium]